MRNRNALLIATLAASCGSLFAQGTTQQPVNPDPLGLSTGIEIVRTLLGIPPPQPPPPPVKQAPPPKTETEKVCVDGKWWTYTYVVTKNSDGSTTKRFDHKDNTGEPCDESTSPTNQSAPNDNSQFSVLKWARGTQNSGPPPVFTPLPPPTSGTGGQALPGPSPRAAAAPGSTAFTFTVPYRALPFTPLYSTSENFGQTFAQCLSQLNATYYVVHHLDGNVTRNDMCTDQVVATIPVTSHPLQVAVTRDGALAIVTSFDSAITFIDTNTNAVIKTLRLSDAFNPSGIAMSPDGTYALVTNYNAAPTSMAVISIATMAVVNVIQLDVDYPQSVFINPDGTLAWVTYPWLNIVEVIDLQTGNINQRLQAQTPFSVAFNSTGTRAYVANGAAFPGNVQVYDTKTYVVLATVAAGAGASDLRVSVDDSVITVNNNLGNSITVIDAYGLTGATFPVTSMPRGTVRVPTQQTTTPQ